LFIDIRLVQLRKLGAEAQERGLPSPRLRVQIGSGVREGTELLWVESALHDRLPRLARSFRIRRGDERRFRETIDELHDEAIKAIQTPSPAAYADIAAIYERMLLALPETWARYGQRYVAGIAGEPNPFELGYLDFLERNLYEEMTRAARAPSRDIAHDALDLPITVAFRALEIRALALWADARAMGGSPAVAAARTVE
jgi:hypothetical protein